MCRTLVFGLALLMAGLGCAAPEQTPPPPNVVFVLVDTLRADRIEAERGGEPVAPFLREFAAESAYFPRALSPCSWTKPALASILTSCWPGVHQVYYSRDAPPPEVEALAPSAAETPMTDRLPDGLETMAEYFTAEGYRSLAVQTNPNLTASQGFAQGFAEGDYPYRPGEKAAGVVDLALAKMGEAKAPFFLYAHFMDPHASYDPPEEYRRLFPLPALTAQEQERIGPAGFWPVFWDQANTFAGLQEETKLASPSPAEREAWRTLYDGEVRYVDAELARLVATVRTKHPNTVFVILSDHGEQFWERGGVGHGGTLHGEETRVPLIVNAPGLGPRRVEAPVSTLGVLPTLAGLLGFEARPAWQGTDLLAHSEAVPAFSMSKGSWPAQRIDLEAVVNQAQLLIVDHKKSGQRRYALEQDPAETRPLPPDASGLDVLKSLLEKHQSSNVERRGSLGVERHRVELDPDIQRKLESIGYLGGNGTANTEDKDAKKKDSAN